MLACVTLATRLESPHPGISGTCIGAARASAQEDKSAGHRTHGLPSPCYDSLYAALHEPMKSFSAWTVLQMQAAAGKNLVVISTKSAGIRGSG